MVPFGDLDTLIFSFKVSHKVNRTGLRGKHNWIRYRDMALLLTRAATMHVFSDISRAANKLCAFWKTLADANADNA